MIEDLFRIVLSSLSSSEFNEKSQETTTTTTTATAAAATSTAAAATTTTATSLKFSLSTLPHCRTALKKLKVL
jgi:hypothetical protein